MASTGAREKMMDELCADFRAGLAASMPRIDEAMSHEGGQASCSCTVEFQHKPARERKGKEVAAESYRSKVSWRERIPFEPRIHELAMDGGQLRLL